MEVPISIRFVLVPLAVLVVFVVAGVALPGRLWADEGVTQLPVPADEVTPPSAPARGAGAPPEKFSSGNIIGDTLRSHRRARKPIFDLGIQDLARRTEDRIDRTLGIRFALAYTTVYQHASEGRGPKDAWGGDIDVVGTWTPRRDEGPNKGSLRVAFENRHRIETEITPQALSNTIDSLWPTVSGFNEQDFALTQVFWRQDLMGDRLRIRIGKLSPYFFFGNRLNDANTAFLNNALADNPEVFFPGNGFGVQARYHLSDQWHVRAGIQNANGIKTEIVPRTLQQGEFWYAIQIARTTDFRRLGRGTWRLGTWYVSAREEADTGSGAGVALSIDQELGEHVIAFLRYGYQGSGLITPDVEDDSLTGTRSSLRVGVGVDSPFAPDDYMGIAVAQGQPSRTRVNDALVGEFFYRLQLTDSSQLSVSLQLVHSSTVFERVFVFGARYRVEF